MTIKIAHANTNKYKTNKLLYLFFYLLFLISPLNEQCILPCEGLGSWTGEYSERKSCVDFLPAK